MKSNLVYPPIKTGILKRDSMLIGSYTFPNEIIKLYSSEKDFKELFHTKRKDDTKINKEN